MFGHPIFDQAVQELQEELGREPTIKEVDNRMADIEAKAIDEAYERARQ